MKKILNVVIIVFAASIFLSACVDDEYSDYDDIYEDEQTEDMDTENGPAIGYDYGELGIFIEDSFNDMDVAGMAVAIIEDDEMTFFAGHGYANIKSKTPVDSDTIFLMASITKTITGTAVMQLVEDGLIDLDTDINEYLAYEVRNPNYPNKKITTRMLLCHTSSIIDNWDVLDKTYTYGADPEISLDEFCHRYFVEGGKWYDDYNNYMDEEPGTYYEYANAGYALLGNIVENITGEEFWDYCKINIFMPLNMNNTSLRLEDLDESEIAIAYSNGEALTHYTFSTYPDGGLRTSCEDFSKFVRMMINKGTCDDMHILKAETVEQVLAEQYVGIANNQGLTWDLAINEIYNAYSDERIIGHNGGEMGAETLMFFNPVSKKGAILLVNDELSKNDTKTYDKIVEKLVEIVE